MDSKQQYKLKKLIQELRKYRGRHTELVTVYIPAGYDLNKIIQHLSEEQGTAVNIKDKTNRLNVQGALDRMIRHLRTAYLQRTPEHGLAVFSGNVSEQEGKQDIKVWSVEPPLPLTVRMYRCDHTFILEPLEDMMLIKDTYGLLVMDNREATLAFLRGKSIQVIRSFGSNVPGKLQVGGWSQQRYARLREEAENEFYKRIAEVLNPEFLAVKTDLMGILIGGPGPTKEKFHNGDYINNELKKKVIGIKDIAYTDEQGLHELIEKSQDLLSQAELVKEKQIVQEFLTKLAIDSDKVAYGINDVKKALEYGAVDKLLLSESLENIEELEDKANSMGTEVFIVSIETKEGGQLRDIGGIAAILRYKIKDL